MKRLTFALALAALCPASAQVLPGSPGAGAPPATTTSNNNYNMVPGSAADRQTDTQTALGNMPMADPGSENVSFNGKLWNVTNNRLMRSRFETYLTTPEANGPEDQAYRDLMAQIMELLAPTHKATDPVTKAQIRGPEVMKAFAMLPEAGAARIDGGLCNAVANAVWDVWTSQKRVNERKLANVAMMERRKQLEWNAEMGMNSTPLAKTGGGASKNGQQNQQQQQQDLRTAPTQGRPHRGPTDRRAPDQPGRGLGGGPTARPGTAGTKRGAGRRRHDQWCVFAHRRPRAAPGRLAQGAAGTRP